MSAPPAAETGGPDGSAALAGPLISIPELARELADGTPPVLLDVRWHLGGPPGIDSYRAGHLPGAVYVDLDAELAGPAGDGGRQLLPADGDFEAAMAGAGVSGDRNVVVYDDGDATIAARLWWMLRYYGHERVRVLDGGYRGWAAAGGLVGTDDVTPLPGEFRVRPGQLPKLDAAGAADLAQSGTLLDARAPARYRGETEPADRLAGHIPGAVSAPTAGNVTSAGLFRPAADLRARFASLGITPGGDGPAVGVYCGSGVTAAHEVLALALAGIPAALYVGSWSGWIADPSRPVATGPQPGRLAAK